MCGVQWFFFFKQKTAYEIKECDWSSDVCSSDLTATLETSRGKIVCELYPKNAPKAVNNFVFLARAGFYDGSTFHRRWKRRGGFMLFTIVEWRWIVKLRETLPDSLAVASYRSCRSWTGRQSRISSHLTWQMESGGSLQTTIKGTTVTRRSSARATPPARKTGQVRLSKNRGNLAFFILPTSDLSRFFLLPPNVSPTPFLSVALPINISNNSVIRPTPPLRPHPHSFEGTFP